MMSVERRRDQGKSRSQRDRIVVGLLWKNDTGTATSINDLAVALDRDGFEVIFIFLVSKGASPGRLGEANRVFSLSHGRIGTAGFLPALIRLTRILRTYHVSVLHCHNPKANVFGTLASVLAGVPATIVQFHGLRRTRGLRRKIENLLVFRRAARIVGVAEAVTQDIAASNWRVPQEKLFVLENSVDYDRFARTEVSRAEARAMLGIADDAVVFGTIGRLTPTKGLPYLLDAFATVRQQMPSARLVLLGDGPDREELERQAENLQCRDAIHFLGYRSNVEQLLRAMDVFVLASVAEGMPRVILEAMAAGVPCVGTAVGGIAEMLDHGRLGLLVPPRDAPALARAMLETAALPASKRQSLIKEARQRARTCYSHDVVRTKLAQLYEQAYEARRTGRGDR